MNEKYISILLIILIFFAVENFDLAQDCKVTGDIFDTSSSYCPNLQNLEKSITQLIQNLDKQLKNPNDECIPEKLREIIKDRFCYEKKINIFCIKKEEVFSGKKKLVWDPCQRKRVYKYFYYKRQGAVADSDEMQLDPELMYEAPDTIEMTLYHELIHAAENYYGEQKLNTKNITEDDYTYTCTKSYYNSGKCTTKQYPDYKECPTYESKCIPCNQYSLPVASEKKK